MKKHVGDLTITQDTAIDFTEITGNLYIYSNVKLDALQSVGGDLSIYSNAKLDALQSVGGDLSIYRNAKLDAPNLKKEKLSQQEINKLQTYPKKLNQQHFEKLGYLFADGILQTIISKKKASNLTIYKTKKIAKEDINFVVYDGEYYSHGETLEQAKNDLIFKRTTQDTSKFKTWKLTDKKTVEELVEAYRSITGACFAGVKDFCLNKRLKDRYTIKEAIEITKDAYNGKTFADFFGGLK